MYLYHFEHAPDVTQTDRCLGVFHGAELPFVFYDKPILDVRERDFGKQMVNWYDEKREYPHQYIAKEKETETERENTKQIYVSSYKEKKGKRREREREKERRERKREEREREKGERKSM